MKKFGKTISMLCAACIMVSGVTLTAFAESSSINEQTIDVKFRQVIDMPDVAAEDAELLALAMEAGATTGWVYNEAEQRFERLVTYDDVEVSVSGTDVDLDTNGRARVLTQANDTVEVEVYDPMLDKTYTQLISGDSTESAIIIDLDISPMFSIDVDNEELEKMDIQTRASTTDPYWSNGEKGVYGYRLHCNRFNGYMGNGTYYSSHTSVQSLLNFFASDCDWALGSYTYCLADYGDNPYCAASPSSKQASCSTLMGHYNRFHMHTTYTGK